MKVTSDSKFKRKEKKKQKKLASSKMNETCLTKCSCFVHCITGWREVGEGHDQSFTNAGNAVTRGKCRKQHNVSMTSKTKLLTNWSYSSVSLQPIPELCNLHVWLTHLHLIMNWYCCSDFHTEMVEIYCFNNSFPFFVFGPHHLQVHC